MTADNSHDNAEFLQRLREAEMMLRKRMDLPSELQNLPILLRDVRYKLDGQRPPVQKLETQLEASRHEVAETRTLLHTLIDSLPVGVMIADGDGEVVMTNDAGIEMLGEDPKGSVQHLENSHSLHRLSGVRVPPERTPIRQALETGETFTGEEYRVRRPDGTERVVLTAARPVTNADDEIVSVLTVFQDITEKKQNEEAVQQYADRLHILRELDRAILAVHPLAPMAQLTLPQLPKLLPCVRASIFLLDRETETLQESVIHLGGKRPPQSAEPIVFNPAWRAVINILERGESYVIENTYTTEQDDPLSAIWPGRPIHAHLYYPIRIRAELVGALCIGLSAPGALSSDQGEFVSELADQLAIAIRQTRLYQAIQRHADALEDRVVERTAALRVSEARFRAVFEEAPVGIVLLDDGARIVQSNAKLESMLARDGAALKATRFYDYVHCEDVGDLQGQGENLVEGSAKTSKIECRLVRPDGEKLWVRITGTLVGEQLDPSPMTLVMVEDVTEEREAQFALIQTEKLALTGRLATSLAHEVNNPLQTVIGCLGLAEEASQHNENIDLYLRMASEELRRAANIVTRLRDLNHRSEPEERELSDVRAIIRQILAITAKQCEERGIDVNADLDIDVPDIYAVPDRLQQVFLNLILNAMDAMPNGGTLKVGVLPLMARRGVKITFEDSGIGIPPGDQAHIFEAFQTTKSDGLGLGLFISQSIIEDHGGTIDVNSQPEEGSTFIIKIPV